MLLKRIPETFAVSRRNGNVRVNPFQKAVNSTRARAPVDPHLVSSLEVI